MRSLILGLTLLLSPIAARAQRITLDPDTCWTCSHSREHFIAGAGLDVGLMLIAPRTRAWQRVVIIAGVGAAYELGQMDIAQSTGRAGQRGFGFGLMDLGLDVLGALVSEGVRRVL